MAIQVKEANQRIVISKGSHILHSALIVDLDRIHLYRERYPLSYHIIQAGLHPQKEIISLYQLGKIIQMKFPESIDTIDWKTTYFYVEYEDYIDKLASIEMSFNDTADSFDYIDKLIHERFDLWEDQRHYDEIVNSIMGLIKCRLREFEIQTPNTR